MKRAKNKEKSRKKKKYIFYLFIYLYKDTDGRSKGIDKVNRYKIKVDCEESIDNIVKGIWERVNKRGM